MPIYGFIFILGYTFHLEMIIHVFGLETNVPIKVPIP